MARYYKRRRLSYRRRRPFRTSRRRYGRRRFSRFRRGFLRRRINYRRGMLRNAKLTTGFFIHPAPGTSPVPSTVGHNVIPSGFSGWASVSLNYEYYKIRKLRITYWNPQNGVGSNIPGQYLNGFLTKINNYNDEAPPLVLSDALNNSTCKVNYLDGRNSTFSYTVYPMYQDLVQRTSLSTSNAMPTKKQWISLTNGSNVQHNGCVTQWWAAASLGLPLALANTGYLLYKYTLYVSFRQRRTNVLQ